MSPIEIASHLVERYESHSSLSYNIDYKIKYFSSTDDTTSIAATIDLIRFPEDSIFGGYVWISSDSIDRYYDTKNVYFISHKNQMITRYTKDEVFPITGNSVRESIRMYFLDPGRLLNGATDSTNRIDISQSMVNGRQTWNWMYSFPDDDYSKNSWKNIWIDKSTYSIPKMAYYTEMQGEHQYNQWDLSNIQFDNVSVDELNNRLSKIKETYAIEDYKERSKEESQPLPNGTKAPTFNGTLYPTDEMVSLEEYRGNLVLLDFWYMDCFPCIQAIPHLNDLQNQYSDRGLVILGINPFDNTEKDQKRLPNFLENNPIDYSILFTTREEPKYFKVYAYPTFYLIDKKGRIMYSGIGFNETRAATVDSLIQALL